MTLRLVNDNEQPGVLYCQSSCYPTRPATILVSISSGLEWGPYLPMCDGCARHKYQAYPGFVRMAPLAEFVDHFAIAREAALATPEQIITPPEQPAMTPAAPARDSNGWTAEERAARKTRQPAARTQHLPGSARSWGIAAIISLVLGFVLCVAGLPDGRESGNEPNGGLIAFGVLFILASVIAGIVCAIRCTPANAGRIRAQGAAAPVQVQYQAGSSQQGIPVGQLATAAALTGAAVLWHRKIKQDQARLADSVLGIAPYNNVAAGMRQTERIMKRQQTTDPQQAALQELQWLNDERPRWYR